MRPLLARKVWDCELVAEVSVLYGSVDGQWL